jgi:pimeloyl-ACP methyl ester carboxylesterase
MAQVIGVSKQFVQANGTDLYCEVRGDGPAVLFITGATGDAGHFEKVAERLADEFTAITYDRRGNSRSPKPTGWTTTSNAEQADDAAGLIEALHLTPAAVVGNSGGAAIALELLLRHPTLVRGGILHEPIVFNPVVAQLPAIMAELEPGIKAAVATGGPSAAVEFFIRVNAGEAALAAIDSEQRQRLHQNGDVLLGIELESFLHYRPDEAAITAVERPVRVLMGRETLLPFAPAVCGWLAALVKTQVGTISGGHGAYWDRPVQMAEELRPYLREITAS